MIIFNFDVLARPGDSLPTRLPDREGLRLWTTFHEQTMGRLAVVVNGDPDLPQLEHWFKVNGIKAAVYEVFHSDDVDVKLEKVQLLTAAAGKMDWYIDVDPRMIAKALSVGIPSLLVANPYVVRPEWSDNLRKRSWDELVEEVDRQALMRAERNWSELKDVSE